ncbi:MAG: hypothetical protein IK090_08360, partial [Clostridia bacterium]|nr:hypothetical protein [Clostridia bacterium]
RKTPFVSSLANPLKAENRPAGTPNARKLTSGNPFPDAVPYNGRCRRNQIGFAFHLAPAVGDGVLDVPRLAQFGSGMLPKRRAAILHNLRKKEFLYFEVLYSVAFSFQMDYN